MKRALIGLVAAVVVGGGLSGCNWGPWARPQCGPYGYGCTTTTYTHTTCPTCGYCSQCGHVGCSQMTGQAMPSGHDSYYQGGGSRGCGGGGCNGGR